MKRLLARLVRWLAYSVLALVTILAVLAVILRFYLPRLDHYKPQVEHLLSNYLGQKITFATLSAKWRGLDVVLRVEGVRVAVENQSGSAMRFGEILVSFNPLSLVEGAGALDRLELVGPTIHASRLADGRIQFGDSQTGKPRGALRSLLQGRNLEIVNGTLVWHDALSSEPRLTVSNIHLQIRPSGTRRRFEFTATTPEDLLHHFSGYGIYDPQSLGAGAWSATVNLRVVHLNLSRIPAVFQERLPWKSRGYVDTSFHARLTGGVLTAASADVTARDFFIPYLKNKKPLAAKRFSSTISWKRSDRQWRLIFGHPEIVLDKTPVSVTRFEVERRKNRRIYSAQDVNVQDLLGVVDRLDIELPWERLIDRLHPRGVFSSASLALTGPYLQATGWRFDGDFRDVGWRAQEAYPGVQGVDGHLHADNRGGQLSLSSSGLELDAPGTLGQPVHFKRVAGDVEWYRWGGDWIVNVDNGEVANDDLDLTDANLYTRVPADSTASPYVLARFRIRRASIGALRSYLPVGKMTAKEVKWLNQALAGGEITGGRFYLNGHLDEVPFDKGGGELRVEADVRDGVLDFNDKWPDLKALNGVIEVNDSHFQATVIHGVFMSSTIESARVWSDDFFKRDRLLRIHGRVSAKAGDVIHFLRRGPLVKNPPPPYSRMSAHGEGILNLSIQLPFTRLKQASRVQGDYTVKDASLDVGDGVQVGSLAGTVHFTESTVEGQDLTGRLFGGPVRADVSTVKPGRHMTFAITGGGEADASRLTPVVGPVLVSELKGRARWRGRLVVGPGPNRLSVKSDLKGVEISFPAPLWKPAQTANDLDVQVEFDRDRRNIVLELEDGLSGQLRYDREQGRSVLTRGVLNLGGGRKLPDAGLAVDIKGPALDVDQWLREIDDLSRLKDKAAQADPGRDALFDHLRFLDVDVDRFHYLHRNLGPVTVAATSTDGKHWTAALTGPRVQGTGHLTLRQTPARYDFEMSRLYWPRLQNGETATSNRPSPKPSDFARLSVQAEDFRYGDMNLGRLDFQGGPENHSWRIEHLSLDQPDLKVQVHGDWSSGPSGAQHSRVEVSANSSDLGGALTQLGFKGQVANGKAKMSASLRWAGDPEQFRLAALNGNLTVKAENGRFLKLEPGSGRLLGLFNVDTLLRRLKLNFTDVFKEGLTFDRIGGKAKVKSGVLRTDGMYILGPSALLELKGSTDLGKETYDLGVTVAPQLGGNLSLAGAIANPAAGAVIFVVQKLFRKQMSKLIQYKYRITGGWDDPQVEAVEHPPDDNGKHLGRN